MNTLDVIKKALSVADGGNLENYLPDPITAEVIQYVREINIMRRLIRVFPMRNRTKTMPKKNGALSAYYVPDGVTATQSSYSAGTVKWEAKKLMSYTMIDEEAVEDSQPDVINDVLQDFGDAIGEAEELAILSGDPSHQATAPTPDDATDANWFRFDPRLIFDGIFTVANSSDASTPVDAGSAAIDLDMINKAIYNLGKYARNRSRLMGLLPSDQAAKIREDKNFKDASVSGQALASFITGLGAAGEGDGIVSVIYGIPFYEVPQAPEGQIAIAQKSTPALGDRRRIKVKSTEVIEADQRKYVVSERIALNYYYRDAIVGILNLDSAV